ncbi:MAG: hypothetical protein K2M17_04685 [Bacilli bacterium]|nr:hypothetical protein [Bacilli bacterium]
MKDKVSHPITCISKPHLHVSDDYYRKYDPYRNREGNFETEFQSHAPRFGIKVNPFPYLNEFVDELATLQATRKLTKEEIMQLAQRFVTAKLESENEDKAVLERKQNGDLKQ